VRRPVLLKRGLSATIEEWLLSRSTSWPAATARSSSASAASARSRRTPQHLDISAIPVVKKRSHLPIVVDSEPRNGPSGEGDPMARAAVAAGADGLIIEVHNNPEKALSDGPQSLYPTSSTA